MRFLRVLRIFLENTSKTISENSKDMYLKAENTKKNTHTNTKKDYQKRKKYQKNQTNQTKKKEKSGLSEQMAVLSRSLGFFFLYFCLFCHFFKYFWYFLIVFLISLFSAIRELPTPLRTIHAELSQRHSCRRNSLKNKSAPWNPAAHSQKCVLQTSRMRMSYCVEFLKDQKHMQGTGASTSLKSAIFVLYFCCEE